MDSPDDPTEDVTLPHAHAQALVAGAVALMTVWADPVPGRCCRRCDPAALH